MGKKTYLILKAFYGKFPDQKLHGFFAISSQEKIPSLFP